MGGDRKPGSFTKILDYPRLAYSVVYTQPHTHKLGKGKAKEKVTDAHIVTLSILLSKKREKTKKSICKF